MVVGSRLPFEMGVGGWIWRRSIRGRAQSVHRFPWEGPIAGGVTLVRIASMRAVLALQPVAVSRRLLDRYRTTDAME
jgi:hypothetical protein